MQGSKKIKKQRRHELKGCGAFCCSYCKLSVASSSEGVAGSDSSPFVRMSSLAHAMVQERLDQMIREREVNYCSRNNGGREKGTKFIVMVAMDKYSYDPIEDFRKSMVEMILANRIDDAQGLRSLLNCYVSMNAKEYRSLILQVFHEVCTRIFLSCKCSHKQGDC